MSTYGSFFHLFLAVSRRLEAAGGRIGSPLSVEASQILGIIAIHAEERSPISAYEIGRLLNIEKSVLSRKLGALSQSGFVVQARSTRDKRAKTLAITKNGDRALRIDEIKRDHQFALFAAGLSERDRRDIISLTRTVADNLGTPRLTAWSRDPLRVEVARVTRALGFLSAGDLFSAGVPLEEAQLLSMLGTSEGQLSVEALTRSLPYDRSKLSRLLHSYAERGLLTIESIPVDKRRKIVALSPQGRREREALESRADPTFDRALGPLPKEKRARLQELLEKLAVESSGRGSQDSILVTRVVSAETITRARAFALREMIERRLEEDAPASFIHPDHTSIAATLDDTIAGILEWRLTSAHVSIENLLLRRGETAARIGEHLLEELLRQVPSDTPLLLGAPYLIRMAKEAKKHELLAPFPAERRSELLAIFSLRKET